MRTRLRASIHRPSWRVSCIYGECHVFCVKWLLIVSSQSQNGFAESNQHHAASDASKEIAGRNFHCKVTHTMHVITRCLASLSANVRVFDITICILLRSFLLFLLLLLSVFTVWLSYKEDHHEKTSPVRRFASRKSIDNEICLLDVWLTVKQPDWGEGRITQKLWWGRDNWSQNPGRGWAITKALGVVFICVLLYPNEGCVLCCYVVMTSSGLHRSHAFNVYESSFVCDLCFSRWLFVNINSA